MPVTRPRPGRARAALLAALALLAWAAGCGAEESGGEGELRGFERAEPLALPAAVLTDTDGRPYDLRDAADGGLTLLFFGYTHCPDVCPVQMAALAGALERLGSEAQREVRVVFVTTDPERDTPARIRAWLDRWDRRFVGLRGSEEAVRSIQRSLGLPPAAKEPPGPDGGYLVGHAAQVIAFAPDGRTVFYPFGTRQADWVHDIPLLLDRG